MYLLWWVVAAVVAAQAHALRAGVGISDVTGPAAEVTFMGYANFQQTGQGIHLRQFSRAFALEQDGNRLVFVSVDAAMMGHGVRKEVLKLLRKRYSSIYNETNVIISGTHTHSTPGGFLMDFLFDLPILGFVKETYAALVAGIFKSIVYAHESMREASAEYVEGVLTGANINRSPTAYLLNPKEERDRYNGDVDETMSQLRFLDESGSVFGVVNWFAVHPTSMNNTNRLISSDNMGYAAVLAEQYLNGPETKIGKAKIVCAFASSNLGDVSPNTAGPRCEWSRRRCDGETQLCGDNERCFASGPGRDMFESTSIIANKLFGKAKELLSQPGEKLRGPVGAAHEYVDMTAQSVPAYDPVTGTFNESNLVSGCYPAMGYSFAAGTTDGPGAFNFTQGTTTNNPLWDAVRDFISAPTPEDVKCQKPKPILLATGRAKFPYEWQPKIVSCTVARIGQLIIAAVPGEFTTMSGRRLRGAVRARAGAGGAAAEGAGVRVVLAGLSNIYSDYIATYEEYQKQRYEAASTIYGPHTLEIYLNKYMQLTDALMKGETPRSSVQPPDLSQSLISLVPPVLWDAAPWGREFGDCLRQPQTEYSAGDLVTATFVAGHPRNNLRHGRSFLAVERLESSGDENWITVATDAHWDTKFIWNRNSMIFATSIAEIQWQIPHDVQPGTYRLHHYGNYKYVLGGIYPYDGFTNTFEVT